MKRLPVSLVVALFVAGAASPAGPTKYQISEPVLDMKEDVITAQKGTDVYGALLSPQYSDNSFKSFRRIPVQ